MSLSRHELSSMLFLGLLCPLLCHGFVTFDSQFDSIVYSTQEYNTTTDTIHTVIHSACTTSFGVDVGIFEQRSLPLKDIAPVATLDLGSGVESLILVQTVTLDFATCPNCSRIVAMEETTPPRLFLLQLQDRSGEGRTSCDTAEIVNLLEIHPYDIPSTASILCMRFTVSDHLYFEAIVLPTYDKKGDVPKEEQLELISATIYHIERDFNISTTWQRLSMGGNVSLPSAGDGFTGALCASVSLPILCEERVSPEEESDGNSLTSPQGWIFAVAYVEGKGLGFLILETPSLNVVATTYLNISKEEALISCGSNVDFDNPSYFVPLAVDQQVVRNVSSYYSKINCEARSTAVFASPNGTIYYIKYNWQMKKIDVEQSAVPVPGLVNGCLMDRNTGLLYYLTTEGTAVPAFFPIANQVKDFDVQFTVPPIENTRTLVRHPDYTVLLGLSQQNRSSGEGQLYVEMAGLCPCPLNPFHVYLEPACVAAGYCGIYCYTAKTAIEGLIIGVVSLILLMIYLSWHCGASTNVRYCCCCCSQRFKKYKKW